MLNYFRRSVWETLQQALTADPWVTLSTCGRAGLLAGRFRCETGSGEAGPGCLYLHVPVSADLLENIAAGGSALVTAAGWQVHGPIQLVDRPADPSSGKTTSCPGSQVWALVELRVARFERMDPESWTALDTFEFEG